jgi:dihydropyrimidinase
MIIANGTVWLEDGPRACDLRLEGGVITWVGGRFAPRDGEEVHDAAGLDVIPGAIDLHVHVDDEIGRFALADSFRSGSYAAIQSGVTAFLAFATQRPGETLAQASDRCLARAAGKCYCDHGLHLTPTAYADGWEDEVRALHARGLRTLKLYTTYREAGLYVDYDRIQRVMALARSLDMAVLVHCEDQEMLDSVDVARHAVGGPAAHGLLRPAVAETVGIEKVVYVAWFTKCRTHIVHVSTEKGVLLVHKSLEYEGRITCETGPQYFLMDEGSLAAPDGYRCLCTPPLRSVHDRAGIDAALSQGAIDVVATDHCAFLRRDKDASPGDWRATPNGIPGVGALLPLTYEFFKSRRGTLADVVRVLARNPARVAGIYPRKGTIAEGSDADLVVVAQDGAPRHLISSIADCHDPHAERTTTLDVRAVFLRGEKVVESNRIVNPETPTGRSLWLS